MAKEAGLWWTYKYPFLSCALHSSLVAWGPPRLFVGAHTISTLSCPVQVGKVLTDHSSVMGTLSCVSVFPPFRFCYGLNCILLPNSQAELQPPPEVTTDAPQLPLGVTFR